MSNLQSAILSLEASLEEAKVKETGSLKAYLETSQLEEELRQGYLEMSPVNLELAREEFVVENKTFFNYEERLAECD